MVKAQRIKVYSGVAAADGTAEAQTNQVHGKIMRVDLDYDASMAATCTVAIGEVDTKPEEGILIITGNTDTAYYPKRLMTDITGEFNTAEYSAGNDIQGDYVVSAPVRISITNATAGKGVTAYLVVEEW